MYIRPPCTTFPLPQIQTPLDDLSRQELCPLWLVVAPKELLDLQGPLKAEEERNERGAKQLMEQKLPDPDVRRQAGRSSSSQRWPLIKLEISPGVDSVEPQGYPTSCRERTP